MNNIKLLNTTFLSRYLKPRPRECHKGDFGKVVIVGGDLGYSGAVRLAGEAAFRAGAGSVIIATHSEHAVSLNNSCPELMCHGISNSTFLNELLERSTFIVVGPGLGMNKWGLTQLEVVLKHQDKSTLFDADALNLLANMQVKMRRKNCIFTPHPGEAARLLGSTADKIQQQRLAALAELQDLLGGIVILKGAGTLISSKTKDIELCKQGNPGMATAGMGDVLTGIIAGLAAQNIPLQDAAKLGVLVHALAGDRSAIKHGERGMMASDLIHEIRYWVNNPNAIISI